MTDSFYFCGRHFFSNPRRKVGRTGVSGTLLPLDRVLSRPGGMGNIRTGATVL